MSIYGTGVITNIVMKARDPDWYPAYRWDKEGSPYYHLRPDRLFAQLRGGADIALLPLLASRELRGVGGPSVTTPTSTIPSKASSGRAMAQAKKSGGPRQVSQRGGRARGKCPKGHYWSYKKKKCVKSKFR